MDTTQPHDTDPVRNATPDSFNDRIDRETEENIDYYSGLDDASIRDRIIALDKEWDIERTLELNASVIAFSGLLLGVTVNKKWLILPALVTAFLAQHAIQGWCPPVPLFRKMGIRTRKEIDREKCELLEVLKSRA